MTTNELNNKQALEEICSNIQAINVYKERIKEQENLLIDKLNKIIPTSIIGTIIYFCDNNYLFL